MKPPQRTEAERIAGTLAKAQQATVVRQGGSHSDVIDEALDPLWFGIRKLGQGQFGLSLTPLGRAVREALLSQEQTDER